MRYRILDNQAAQEIATSLLAGQSVDFKKHEQEVGKGASLPENQLQTLAQDIRKVKKTLEKKKASREDLDRLAFELIHRALPNDPDMLGDIRFWVRFTLAYIFDVVVWRFPGKGSSGFNLENMGISPTSRKRLENYAYKLWVRGDLSRMAKGKDAYRLGRHGQVDFWTSHIHRQGFTQCRSIATEFIQFQYPEKLKGKPRLLEGQEDAKKGKFGVRTLVKRLRRMWATIEYTLLDTAEAQKLLKELSKGLKGPDGKPVSS